MNIIGNFFRAWWDTAKDRDFRDVCRYHEVLPYQVGSRRSFEDLEKLRLAWLEDVRPAIMDGLSVSEKGMYGYVINPNDRVQHNVIFWTPDFVSVMGGRRSSYHFTQEKGFGDDYIFVETGRYFSAKPTRMRRIPLDALNLRELKKIFMV